MQHPSILTARTSTHTLGQQKDDIKKGNGINISSLSSIREQHAKEER
jgi:hypothetical protein